MNIVFIINNKITRLGLIIAALFLFMSCDDGFLARQPLDEITSKNYWNTLSDLKIYNNSLYDMLGDGEAVPVMIGNGSTAWNSRYLSLRYLDELSDNMATVAPRHLFYKKRRSGHFSVPSSVQWYGWKGWEFVREINVGLAHYNEVDAPQKAINKYAAEARLMRAWFYATKVQYFGRVPWIDEPLNVNEEEKLYGPRDPRKKVMKHVLEDLNFAIKYLPKDWDSDGQPGRLDKWVALALKSRICLFEGTWRKYHHRLDLNYKMWLKEAAEAAKRIIDSGKFQLYPDYGDLFKMLDYTGVDGVIYWKDYKVGVMAHYLASYFPRYSGGATKSLVYDYLCIDGLPIKLSHLYQGDRTLRDVFKNRDPRMIQSILSPTRDDDLGYYARDDHEYPRFAGMPGGMKTSTGFHIIKFYIASQTIGHAYGTMTAPAIIFRYGEVLLNYAEAKAALGTITQHDLDISINQLRDRVGMPHMIIGQIPQDPDPRYANNGVPTLMDEIRRERRVELAFEGFRYNDIRRWGRGELLEQKSLGMRWDAWAKQRFPKANVGTYTNPKTGKTYIDPYEGTVFAHPVLSPKCIYGRFQPVYYLKIPI